MTAQLFCAACLIGEHSRCRGGDCGCSFNDHCTAESLRILDDLKRRARLTLPPLQAEIRELDQQAENVSRRRQTIVQALEAIEALLNDPAPVPDDLPY